MTRREVFGAMAASTAIAQEDTSPLSWLNRYTSAEIWKAVIMAGVGAEVKRVLNRSAQKTKRAQRRAERLAAGVRDTVLWRGVVADDLPRHSEPREVQDRRKRDVLVATAKGGAWHGTDIPTGSRILVDSRCPADSLIGQRGEIISCADGRIRIHVWPANRRPNHPTQLPIPPIMPPLWMDNAL